MDAYFLFSIVVAIAFVWIAVIVFGMDRDVNDRVDFVEENYVSKTQFQWEMAEQERRLMARFNDAGQ